MNIGPRPHDRNKLSRIRQMSNFTKNLAHPWSHMYRPMAVIKFASLSETTCFQKYEKHGWVHLWVGELMGPMASIHII